MSRTAVLAAFAAVLSLSVAELACEKTEVEITCPDDAFISITSAVYGRTSMTEPTCGRGPESLQSDSCALGSSQSTVEAECNSLPSCSFEVTNEFFGTDPCPNVVKYLNYTWECEGGGGGGGGGAEGFMSAACEGDDLVLRCPGDLVIDIDSSNFGRTETTTETCGFGPASLTDTNCFDTAAPEIIADACQGENECTLPVSIDDFSGTDPCPGTKKVAEVSYDCVEGGDLPTDDAEQVCEKETATIECDAGVITIEAATFGRQATVPTCGKGPASLTNTSCGRIDNALDTIAELCDGETSCEISVTVDDIGLGDPCPGTVKYLEYEFSCGDGMPPEETDGPDVTESPMPPVETDGPVMTPAPSVGPPPPPPPPPTGGCGGMCMFSFAGGESSFAIGAPDVAFTSAIVSGDFTLGHIDSTGEAYVVAGGSPTLISEWSPANLSQPFSPSFFKSVSVESEDGEKSGIAHEYPQGNQVEYLGGQCIVVPLTAYQELDENGLVINNFAGSDPFKECVSFTIA
eukprot:CAMPEP_0198312602 /NCGR_PEP_ID=MMETSP1450-20131203/3906_1 /TAXON_ID=753684 ORGANISM="Madagascaria erythrocladiodes, Strain CCMP3234" /NCGR_SAMPLE_ID=MMETSP1450 /ASSEMBLY_ACC=CAM_ASM_001115 /LENGTH=517 /DNA_ID=CAMNT_0044015553 /DNA_START=128 /DNA_END=1681 /DNA_ORIENTATION=-